LPRKREGLPLLNNMTKTGAMKLRSIILGLGFTLAMTSAFSVQHAMLAWGASKKFLGDIEADTTSAAPSAPSTPSK